MWLVFVDDSPFDDLRPDLAFFKDLGRGIWLMDDHRWALYIWEKIRETRKLDAAVLIHADYHWDAIDDCLENAGFQEKIEQATVADILDMTKASEKPIQYDSFIAPAVRRKVINTIHWLCLKPEDDTAPGFNSEFLSEFECDQIFHTNHAEFIDASIEKPILFDLCLDLFNHDDDRMYEGTIWSNDEIDSFLQSCRKLIFDAEVITVSLSFGYSGSRTDTIALARHILPNLFEQRAT